MKRNIILLFSIYCSIMAYAQKEYNGVMTETSPCGIFLIYVTCLVFIFFFA